MEQTIDTKEQERYVDGVLVALSRGPIMSRRSVTGHAILSGRDPHPRHGGHDAATVSPDEEHALAELELRGLAVAYPRTTISAADGITIRETWYRLSDEGFVRARRVAMRMEVA